MGNKTESIDSFDIDVNDKTFSQEAEKQGTPELSKDKSKRSLSSRQDYQASFSSDERTQDQNSSGTEDERDLTAAEEFITNDLPIVYLPGENVRYCDTAKALADAYWKAPSENRLYNLNRQIFQVVRNNADPTCCELCKMDSKSACSHFETVSNLMKKPTGNDKEKAQTTEKTSICSPSIAASILSSNTFIDGLPKIKLFSSIPVIVKTANGSKVISQYDKDTEIYCPPMEIEALSLEEAKAVLKDMLSDFHFKTAGDKSRAYAALLTPALLAGGVLRARAPMFMLEADKSQTGKGYFTKLQCAVYGLPPHCITQRNGAGIGSLDEMFYHALSEGHTVIVLDNLRGDLDSTAIESFMTSDSFSARTAYKKTVDVDPQNFFVMATSNRVQMTTDMGNRTCFIRFIKQPSDYKFKAYTDKNLDILEYVKANRGKYIGAIFAVIKAWINSGCQVSADAHHDFRAWSCALDWIVSNILDQAPLMDDHKAVQLAALEPDVEWVNNVAKDILKANLANKPLKAEEIVENSESSTDFPEKDRDDFAETDAYSKQQMLMRVGRRIAKVFRTVGENDILDLGSVKVTKTKNRTRYDSGNSAAITHYTFKTCE